MSVVVDTAGGVAYTSSLPFSSNRQGVVVKKGGCRNVILDKDRQQLMSRRETTMIVASERHKEPRISHPLLIVLEFTEFLRVGEEEPRRKGLG